MAQKKSEGRASPGLPAQPSGVLSPESPANADLVGLIGPNLKRLRQDRGLSLDGLANLADVSRAMLSQIERQTSVPTINVVWKLARAFGVPFSALIADNAAQPVHEMLAADAQRLESASGKMSTRALFPVDAPPRAEFYELRLRPGGFEESGPHPDGAVENLVVATGTLEVSIGNTVHPLAPGDAILFPGDQPHAYRNRGAAESVVYLVMTYPKHAEA